LLATSLSLFLGEEFSAQQMAQTGFVSEVFADGVFAAKLLKKAKKIAALPPQALQVEFPVMRVNIYSRLSFSIPWFCRIRNCWV